MALRIAGLGTAVPQHAISQRDAAELSRAFCLESEEKLRLLPVLYRRTGVKKRHSVLLEAPDGEPLLRQSFYPEAQHAADGGPTTRQRRPWRRWTKRKPRSINKLGPTISACRSR